MKTLSIGLLIVLMSVSVIGCNSAPGASAAPDSYSSYYPYMNGGFYGNVGTGTTLPPFTAGATSTLTIDGSGQAQQNQLFGQYTGRSMNNPQNIQVNVNLSKTYNGQGYGGTITVRYQDNGITYQGTFGASQADPQDTAYNIFFNYGGKKVFHGFFEDSMGAIIIVFDQIYDLGDGSPTSGQSTGSIYFKNFNTTYAPHPPAHCWRVSIGPYDCRAWKWGDGVATTYAIYPESFYYQRLGTFSTMNLYQAFNTTVLQ